MKKFGNILSGEFARSQPFAHSKYPVTAVFGSLNALLGIVQKWNTPDTAKKSFLPLVQELKTKVHLAGWFTSQLLAKVLIRLAIINRPDLANEAVISPDSGLYPAILKNSNKEKASKNEKQMCVARFLNSAASAIGQTPAVTENLFCEMYRQNMRFDLTIPLNPIYATAMVDNVPTMFKFLPDASGRSIRSPVVPPELGANTPSNRIDNHRWWLENPVQPESQESVYLNGGPKVPNRNTWVDLTQDGLRERFVSTYLTRDLKTLNEEYKKHCQVIKKLVLVHPYAGKGEPGKVIANFGRLAGHEVWQKRLLEGLLEADTDLDEYAVLSPDALLAKYDNPDDRENGLGLVQDYPLDHRVSVFVSPRGYWVEVSSLLTHILYLFSTATDIFRP